MLAALYWNPNPEIFTIPFINFPILWYGVFFALGFWLAFLIIVRVFIRYFELSLNKSSTTYKRKAQAIADRLTLFVVIGTLLGARLGHFLFYESPSMYLAAPMEFFQFRQGGLASHGAVVGIILAVVFFSYRIRRTYPDLSWVRLLDFIAVPAALTAACIRVGNFFNQEILGTPSNLPWAIIFGNPADGRVPEPLHPAQLYEAVWYLAIFAILLRLSYRPNFLLTQGRLIGTFLVLVFLFRFFIEYLKTEQSQILNSSLFTMGQVLSIPVILIGLFLYFRGKKLSRAYE